MENWNQLGEDQQKAIITLHQFYCGLHTLVGMAEILNSVLCDSEKRLLPADYSHPPAVLVRATEPGAFRPTRVATKALAFTGGMSSLAHTWGLFYKIQNSDFRFRNQSAESARADLSHQRAAFLLSATNLNLKSEF